MSDQIPASYRDARAAFLAAAATAGARLEHVPHARRGLHDEELFVDVAEVGPPDAQDVVVIVSGTHGVEGYLGSALQSRHLESLGGSSGTKPTRVFVHALNPFGFSWVRRVNEDNIDLNRNFVDWTQDRPATDAYDGLAAALVPGDWTEDTQQRTFGELLEHSERMGLDAFQQAVSGGQWTHPTGLFYGGSGPAWSNEWLQAFLARRLGGCARAAIIDIHTGLGPSGHGELISTEHPTSPTYARQQAWWGDVTSAQDGSSVSADVSGDWMGTTSRCAPDTEITGVALEYGTVDPITVMQALRADAVLHAHGDPRAPEAAAVRAQVRAAFLDDDPAWLATCAARYDEVVTVALDRLS